MGLSILIAAGLGLASAILLIRLGLTSNWAGVWASRPTDWHHDGVGSVPRLGGAVLATAFVVVEAYIALFHPELRAVTPGRDAIIAGSLAMFALGFCDDLRPVRAEWKLLGQVLIASGVCLCGVGIEVGRVPFTTTTVALGAWGPVLTVLWLVGLTNLINLIDGIDGLAGGTALMLMLMCASVAHPNGNFELLASGMAGALVGFLRFNFPPARIYLGDGGAYFLGFQVALFSIVNSHKGTVAAALVAPLFVLAFAVSDACFTVARRGLHGLPLFRPDRKHLHHRLVDAGGSRRKVVLLVYSLNLVFLAMGLAAFWSRGEAVPVLLGAAVLVLFACAGTCRFSRRWFAIPRVLRSSLRIRAHVKYARCLLQWLKLQSRRRSGPDEFWADLVFAADRLGFGSVKLTLQEEDRFWRRPDTAATTARRQFECARGLYGKLELTAPVCPLRPAQPMRECDRDCGAEAANCLADPRVFEILSELLAETWTRSAVQWNGEGVPLRFKCRKAEVPFPRTNRPTRLMKRIVTIWTALLLAVPLASAEPLSLIDLKASLSQVPAAELPIASAALIQQAKPRDRAGLTTNVVRCALGINPAATPFVVGALGRMAPETASVAALVASLEQPDQVGEIARAAVGAAPERAAEIVVAVCGVLPAEYKTVAVNAARVAPQVSRGILQAVGAVRPELKPFIDRELDFSGRPVPSVAGCLERAERARPRANPPGLAHRPEPKRGSGGGPPEDSKPPRGDDRPPGGRNYARP